MCTITVTILGYHQIARVNANKFRCSLAHFRNANQLVPSRYSVHTFTRPAASIDKHVSVTHDIGGLASNNADRGDKFHTDRSTACHNLVQIAPSFQIKHPQRLGPSAAAISCITESRSAAGNAAPFCRSPGNGTAGTAFAFSASDVFTGETEARAAGGAACLITTGAGFSSTGATTGISASIHPVPAAAPRPAGLFKIRRQRRTLFRVQPSQNRSSTYSEASSEEVLLDLGAACPATCSRRSFNVRHRRHRLPLRHFPRLVLFLHRTQLVRNTARDTIFRSLASDAQKASATGSWPWPLAPAESAPRRPTPDPSPQKFLCRLPQALSTTAAWA